VLAGCGGDTGSVGSGGSPDMAQPSMLLSSCGHPGDTGNSKGVGKFCQTLSDCAGAETNICSALGNGPKPSAHDSYFCTIYPCHADAGTNECGENATCICGSGSGGSGCACTPNSCLH
jgi:hypothetical protein